MGLKKLQGKGVGRKRADEEDSVGKVISGAGGGAFCCLLRVPEITEILALPFSGCGFM